VEALRGGYGLERERGKRRIKGREEGCARRLLLLIRVMNYLTVILLIFTFAPSLH